MNRSKKLSCTLILPSQEASTYQRGDYRPGIFLLLKLNGVKVSCRKYESELYSIHVKSNLKMSMILVLKLNFIQSGYIGGTGCRM